MKFSNVIALVALATGAVQALPAPDANANANELMAREAKGASSVTKQLKNVQTILTTLTSSIEDGVSDVSTLLSLVGSASGVIGSLL